MTTKTIWQFELRTVDVQTVTMPRGAALLSLQVQRGVPCIWGLVDPMAPVEERTFVTFGTGHPVPAAGGMTFLGTYKLASSDLMFHVFEVNAKAGNRGMS